MGFGWSKVHSVCAKLTIPLLRRAPNHELSPLRIGLSRPDQSPTTRPNPTISSEKKKKHISEKIQFSAGIFQFPAKFSSFRRNFQFPAKIPDSGDAFSSDLDAFFNSGTRSDPTDANHDRKPNRPIFPAVGFGLLRPSTRRRRVESRLGRKPTRPDPWTALIERLIYLSPK